VVESFVGWCGAHRGFHCAGPWATNWALSFSGHRGGGLGGLLPGLLGVEDGVDVRVAEGEALVEVVDDDAAVLGDAGGGLGLEHDGVAHGLDVGDLHLEVEVEGVDLLEELGDVVFHAVLFLERAGVEDVLVHAVPLHPAEVEEAAEHLGDDLDLGVAPVVEGGGALAPVAEAKEHGSFKELRHGVAEEDALIHFFTPPLLFTADMTSIMLCLCNVFVCQ